MQTLPGIGGGPSLGNNEEVGCENDMKALEANMNRLNEAEKMPPSPRKEQYVLLLNKRIDVLMKKIEGTNDDGTKDDKW